MALQKFCFLAKSIYFTVKENLNIEILKACGGYYFI